MEREDITCENTRHQKVGKLIDVVMRKGAQAFEAFLESLREDTPHLYEALVDTRQRFNC
jgi:pheromone shutdown protein TraB